MKYIVFTYVDAVTGIPVTQAPATNGPVFPQLPGLQFVRAQESRYPTLTPRFFGTVDDEADTSTQGVLEEMTAQSWAAAIAEELKAQATALRWRVMTRGMTLAGGMAVGTAIDDQNRITSVVANVALAGLADQDEVDFKSASGWVRISIAQVKQIAGAIGQFVQACYTAERAHHEAIDLLTTAQELHAYDVNAGWPANGPSE